MNLHSIPKKKLTVVMVDLSRAYTCSVLRMPPGTETSASSVTLLCVYAERCSSIPIMSDWVDTKHLEEDTVVSAEPPDKGRTCSLVPTWKGI